MFTVKRERTGRILETNFDHEVTVLDRFGTRTEAEVNLRARFHALRDDMPFNPSFQGNETGFVMTISDPDYCTVTRFYIEEEKV